MLYDTWENMLVTDLDAWSHNQNQLIATIRSYSPQALVFVEDGGTAYEAIAAGTIPDLARPNVVWTFHLYNASVAGCAEPASARYGDWPQNAIGLVNFAQQHGHAAAITEWGGCNDSEPYHTNITSFPGPTGWRWPATPSAASARSSVRRVRLCLPAALARSPMTDG